MAIGFLLGYPLAGGEMVADHDDPRPSKAKTTLVVDHNDPPLNKKHVAREARASRKCTRRRLQWAKAIATMSQRLAVANQYGRFSECRKM